VSSDADWCLGTYLYKNIIICCKFDCADGYYVYRWTAPDGKRHGVVAKTLDELRIREDEIQRDQLDGLKTITRDVTLNTIYTVPLYSSEHRQTKLDSKNCRTLKTACLPNTIRLNPI